MAGKRAKLDRANNIRKKSAGIEKRRKQRDYDVCHDVAATPISDKTNENKNKQALEMAQQSIKKIAEQMTMVYNNLQAEEKENDNPDEKKGKLNQRKQKPVHQIGTPTPMHPKA